jgi:hypothetical protein
VSVDLAIRLLERHADRVIVAVILDPCHGPTCVDGVGVELFSRERDSLSHRVLLPISGTLTQPMSVQVELRADSPLPLGAFIQGQCWQGCESFCAVCPADPSTELEAHVRGRHPVACARRAPESAFDPDLEGLSRAERARLAAVFPWVDGPRAPVEGCVPCLDAMEDFDELSEELGLDEAEAALLREILEA